MTGGIKNTSGPQKGVNGTVKLSNTELPNAKENIKEEYLKPFESKVAAVNSILQNQQRVCKNIMVKKGL